MAATGTPTPNIGLRIPQGTDPASVDDINYNSNLIDTKLGAVGNDSVQDQIDSLNSKIANIGTVLTNVATKNAVECPNNGTSTVIGTITLPKGTWMLILGGWGPLGSTTVDATSISTGYPIANSTLCTRLFNLIAYAQITNSSETFNISVINWESTSKTSETGYNVFAIKVSE